MKVTLPQTAIIVVWHLSYPLSTHMHTHTHTHTHTQCSLREIVRKMQ